MTFSGRGIATTLSAIAFLVRAAAAVPPAAVPAAPGHEIAGRIELLEKGKPSGDRTLLPRNTVVYFEPSRKPPAPKPVKAEMSTLKKEFQPRLLVVPIGSTVTFPNLDPILHNVFSITGKNAFDLGLAGKGPGKSATFRETGIVRVFCNVHHGMFAYVVVVDTPYWTQAGDDGRFRIAGVPPGPGKLTVWNERSAPSTRELMLPAASPLQLGIEITMPRIPPHKNKLGKSYGGTNYG
jgi:plastocyanin